MNSEGNFRGIWKWKGSERIKFFLWKAMSKCLLTNLERVRRHMAICNLCPICGGGEESLFHTFRDCNRIRMLWSCLKVPNPREFYNNNNWCNWLNNNLCKTQITEIRNWKLTFGTILDSIWRARNDYVFNGKVMGFQGILLRAQDLATSIADSGALFRNMHPMYMNCNSLQPQCWIRPPFGTIKLNVDGSVSDNGFRSGCGGVARNHDGEFVFGFSKKLPSCSAIEAELLAMDSGIGLALDRGMRNLIIESDADDAVELVVGDVMTHVSLSSIIGQIKSKLGSGCLVKWSKVPRELNLVADSLAKYSLFSTCNFDIFDVAPHLIDSPLLDDKMGRLLV